MRPKRSARKPARQRPTVIRRDAAGIDIGARSIHVAVDPDGDPRPVREFPTFTQDLYALADWLQACRVRTVAMESTGVFWIPLFQILEARGFEVCLVNARHVKHVPGRKTDITDAQWLQYLHSVGLLTASFRPAQTICGLRSLLRHRESLIQAAASHVQRMQKALDQMNLQLHHVISDITGLTGLAIVDAILAGERDATKLAALRNWRIHATVETVTKALVGDYRPEHVFTLRQSVGAYRYYQRTVAECDVEIERHLTALPDVHPGASSPPTSAVRRKPRGNEPAFDLRTHLHRLFGVDLTHHPRDRCAHGAYAIHRGRSRSLKVSHARRVRILARTVSRQPDQRREGAQREDPAGEKSRSLSASHVGASGARQSRRNRRLLSTDAGQTGGTESHHRHGSQTGEGGVSPDQDTAVVSGIDLSQTRSQPSRAGTQATPRPGRRTRTSACSGDRCSLGDLPVR